MNSPLQQVKFGALVALMATSTIGSLVTTTRVNALVDCSNDAVIRCGVTYSTQGESKAEIIRSIQTSPGLYKISVAAKDYLRNHEGSVNIAQGILYANGNITIGNEVVAKESKTYGREFREDRTAVVDQNNTYYRGDARVFVSPDEGSLVYVALTSNGEYIASVFQACGNPVDAVAVKQPTPPKPETPKPAPEAPIVSVVHVETPAPATKVVTPVVQPVTESPKAIASTGPSDIIIKTLSLGTASSVLMYAFALLRRNS